MSNSNNWASVIDSLSENHQETLLGASLSKQFARLPLWLSHPSNIGGFYGFLIALALILPYRFAGEDNSGWMSDWALHCALLMAACFFLGLCSTVITAISGRFPVAPPRMILYPMPFVGLGIAIDKPNRYFGNSSILILDANTSSRTTLCSFIMGTKMAVIVYD